MKIAHRLIGPEHPPLVVAEIGINHGGDLEVAKAMATAARLAGCEMVKHQTHFVDDEMTDEAKSVFPPNADRSIWQVMADCALSPEDEIALKRHVESLGMIYVSTPFSRAAADFLHDIGVAAFKIGSGECNHLPLIRHIARMGRPVIMSTGMQTIESLKPSVEILDRAGIPYALLECTNLYPSPPEIVSLQGIAELRRAFPNAVIGPQHRPVDGAGRGCARGLHHRAALHRQSLPDRTRHHLLDGSCGAAFPDRSIARNPYRPDEPEGANRAGRGGLSVCPRVGGRRPRPARRTPDHRIGHLGATPWVR
jgi:hypothetical protein